MPPEKSLYVGGGALASALRSPFPARYLLPSLLETSVCLSFPCLPNARLYAQHLQFATGSALNLLQNLVPSLLLHSVTFTLRLS